MLKCQRNKFNLSRKYSYLNCAYMSPMLKKVENAGRKGIMMKRKPYQVGVEDFFKNGERLRSLYSRLVDNAEPNRVVIIPSVSYGMANVAKNIPKKKGKIIVPGEQFPSNVYPWISKDYELVCIPAPPEYQNRTMNWNTRILDAIDEDTAMVALGHVHWADGTRFDLHEIRKKTEQFDSLMIIDGTQSIGALPFSISKFKPDALVVAGYKWLMGPYSIGMAYYGERFDGGIPIEENWINRENAQDFAGLVNYEEHYQDGSLRYEVGEHSNFILLPMMIEALKQILHWSPEGIQRYCNNLIDPHLNEIREMGYRMEEDQYRCNHLFGIRLPNHLTLQQLKSAFSLHKISVSIRGNSIRVSPNVYNDAIDMNRFIRALKSVLE